MENDLKLSKYYCVKFSHQAGRKGEAPDEEAVAYNLIYWKEPTNGKKGEAWARKQQDLCTQDYGRNYVGREQKQHLEPLLGGTPLQNSRTRGKNEPHVPLWSSHGTQHDQRV